MSLPLAIFLSLELGLVSWIDLKTRKISNWWTIGNFAIFIVLCPLFPASYPLSWQLFQYPLILLALGFALFALKIMGAGDAKYLFGYSLLVPPGLHEISASGLVYATILFGFPLLAVNAVRNFDKIILAYNLREWSLIKGVFGKKFAYAPVILGAHLWLIAKVKPW